VYFAILRLPNGCWLLVVGCWLLVVGCWLLVGVIAVRLSKASLKSGLRIGGLRIGKGSIMGLLSTGLATAMRSRGWFRALGKPRPLEAEFPEPPPPAPPPPGTDIRQEEGEPPLPPGDFQEEGVRGMEVRLPGAWPHKSQRDQAPGTATPSPLLLPAQASGKRRGFNDTL
jgi:hypothetical protein